MQFSPNQQLALSSIMGYLRDAAIPMRSPGYEEMGYWGRPITQSKVDLIADSVDWQILQSVSSPDEYNSIIREYIACPLYLPTFAGIQFRLRVDEAVLDMNLPAGIERHHRGGINVFTLIKQKVQYVLTDQDRFVVEVRNQSGNSVLMASALYGWHYYNPVGTISQSDQPQADAGAPSHLRDEIDYGALRHFDD